MVVAARATNRDPQECTADRVNLFVDDITTFLFRVLLGIDFDTQRQEGRSVDLIVCNSGGLRNQQVARNLLMHKYIVGSVSIELSNHVVSITPRQRVRFVFVSTVGIGITCDIQPVSPPAFPVMR